MKRGSTPKPIGYVGVIAAAIAIGVMSLFNFFGEPQVGLAAAISTNSLLLIVAICWHLKKEWWFWTVIASVCVIHVPIVIEYRWVYQWTPGFAMLPIALVDFGLTIGAVRLAEKIVKKFGRGVEIDNST